MLSSDVDIVDCVVVFRIRHARLRVRGRGRVYENEIGHFQKRGGVVTKEINANAKGSI